MRTESQNRRCAVGKEFRTRGSVTRKGSGSHAGGIVVHERWMRRSENVGRGVTTKKTSEVRRCRVIESFEVQ